MKNVILKSLTFACLLLGSALPAAAQAPDQRLIVTAPSVLDDARASQWSGRLNPEAPSDGAWHFGKLMTQMAGSTNASDFVLAWLNSWKTDQQINGFTAPARPKIDQIIQTWPKLKNGKLDLTQAPFRLLAIVNRMDLRLPRGIPTPLQPVTDAGEGRLVYGIFDPANPTSAFQFTVILEYKLPAATGADTREWAALWDGLKSETLGSAGYNAKLEVITNRFTSVGAAPQRLNGSAISQVRTNEIHLSLPWELREFRLAFEPATKSVRLGQTTTANSPSFSLSGSTILKSFVSTHQVELESGNFQMPERFSNIGFLGASSLNSLRPWALPPPTTGLTTAFQMFAGETCNSCHGASTRTRFLHISPRKAGQPAALSGFMATDLARRKTLFDALVAAPASSSTEMHAAELALQEALATQETPLSRVH
jgi:hypothetical protein